VLYSTLCCIYWNETLRADTYKSKLDFTAFQKEHDLDFHALDNFGGCSGDYLVNEWSETGIVRSN